MQSKKAAARRADRIWRFVRRKRRRNMPPNTLATPAAPSPNLMQALQDISAKGSAYLMMALFSPSAFCRYLVILLCPDA